MSWAARATRSLSLRFRLLADRPNLLKALGNTGWLFFDNVLRMALGFIVGVWVARYLGPEQFGLLNYSVALVALFAAMAPMGVNNIVVRDLISCPETAQTTLGTACLLQGIGGTLAWAMSITAVHLLRPGDQTALLVVAILGFALLYRCLDVVRYWFEAKVQSKYIVWVENVILLVSASAKILLILAGKSLTAFVYLSNFEALVTCFALLGIYKLRGGVASKWKVRFARARELFRDGWPLTLSGLAAMIYMRIDQVMLGQMLGDKSVGIFSAALRLSEVWYFLPMAISASVFPQILQSRANSTELYCARLQKLFSAMVILALALAVPITFSAHQLMRAIYGPGFEDSAQVLVIHIWGSVFVFLGVAGGRWFIAESLQKHTLYRTVAGGVVNVLLNLILIPRYGPLGAAVASVIGQAVASVLFNAVNGATRPLFFMQLKAIAGIGLWRVR